MSPQPPEDVLALTPDERAVRDELLQLPEEELLRLLQMLHDERMLEFGIYSSREQWLWIPWTTCLGGALLAVAAPNWPVAVFGPAVAGAIAMLFTIRRMPGLKASYDALNMRHKWVVALTESAPSSYRRLVPLGFRERLLRQQRGAGDLRVLDDIHVDGFAYPRRLILWTPVVFATLTGLGVLTKLLL
jgi:hypothetical protein